MDGKPERLSDREDQQEKRREAFHPPSVAAVTFGVAGLPALILNSLFLRANPETGTGIRNVAPRMAVPIDGSLRHHRHFFWSAATVRLPGWFLFAYQRCSRRAGAPRILPFLADQPGKRARKTSLVLLLVCFSSFTRQPKSWGELTAILDDRQTM